MSVGAKLGCLGRAQIDHIGHQFIESELIHAE